MYYQSVISRIRFIHAITVNGRHSSTCIVFSISTKHTHTHTFRHVFEHSVQHVSCHFGLQHIHLIRQYISVCMCNKFSIFLCGMCACILNLLAMHSVDIQGIMNTKMAIPKKWIILGMYFNSYF